MFLYCYDNLEIFKLILLKSDGTKFSHMIDEMVEIEVEATHKYLNVLKKLGKPSPKIDTKLEHMIITGMFNTYFELIIHEMPIEDAKLYLKEMREFYTAGWMKIMGQAYSRLRSLPDYLAEIRQADWQILPERLCTSA